MSYRRNYFIYKQKIVHRYCAVYIRHKFAPHRKIKTLIKMEAVCDEDE